MWRNRWISSYPCQWLTAPSVESSCCSTLVLVSCISILRDKRKPGLATYKVCNQFRPSLLLRRVIISRLHSVLFTELPYLSLAACKIKGEVLVHVIINTKHITLQYIWHFNTFDTMENQSWVLNQPQRIISAATYRLEGLIMLLCGIAVGTNR